MRGCWTRISLQSCGLRAACCSQRPHHLRKHKRNSSVDMLDRGIHFKYSPHNFCRHHLAGVALDRNCSMVENDDPVGKVHRQVQIVEHRNDGGVFAYTPLGDFNQIDLVAQIEARCRFIEQQEPGPKSRLSTCKLNQNARQMRALLLAAGKRR